MALCFSNNNVITKSIKVEEYKIRKPKEDTFIYPNSSIINEIHKIANAENTTALYSSSPNSKKSNKKSRQNRMLSKEQLLTEGGIRF